MSFPFIQESLTELANLEQRNPMMRNRLRFFRFVKANPTFSVGEAAIRFGILSYDVERWAGLYQLGGINLLLHPRTLLNPQDGQNLTFSQHAEIRTLELFKEHNNQIGRQLWVDLQNCKKGIQNPYPAIACDTFGSYTDYEANHRNWYRTDCQTYILDVLRYAFEKIGYQKLYTQLLAAFKREGTTGTVMAKYLVRNQWKAYFFMPDAVQPNDGNEEHIKKYENASKLKTWWGVPITDVIVNYRPTTVVKKKDAPAYRVQPIAQDVEGLRKLGVLSTALFGVGVFTEGLHTALFSKGKIYEVHWRGTSSNQFNDPVGRGDDLYGRVDLSVFEWIEGIVVIPPDISL